MRPKIFLYKKKEAPVRRFHPWIFSGAIHHTEGEIKDGDLVEVYGKDDTCLAIGHYQKSSIAVRIIAFENVENDLDFWIAKIQNAYDYRLQIGLINAKATNCYRLIHAEGDGLPGLIIDIYGTVAVVQCHSIGMYFEKEKITSALQQIYGEKLSAIYNKSEATLPNDFAAGVENGYLFGDSAASVVEENGHSFLVDWEIGQKTGFFLDQRDNRQLLKKYAAGKSVLNAFCYSGGFSIYALAAGAKTVHSVDISQKAIDWAEKNVSLNPSDGSHESYCSDVLKFLKESTTEYDVMVVDPPAFAKNLRKRHNAVQGYKRLNAAALSKIKSGGILFTFSCSQVVDKPLFYNTIVAAAIEAGRKVRVMHHLSQGADHPVSLFHPESSYLKGLVLFVE